MGQGGQMPIKGVDATATCHTKDEGRRQKRPRGRSARGNGFGFKTPLVSKRKQKPLNQSPSTAGTMVPRALGP